MGVIRLALSLWLGSLGAAAAAERLMCLGTDPMFILSLQGDSANFDYLGDGTFALAPPFDAAAPEVRRTLRSSRVDFPVFVEARTCSVRNLDMPFTVEIGVPSSAGLRPFQGCCILKRDD